MNYDATEIDRKLTLILAQIAEIRALVHVSRLTASDVSTLELLFPAWAGRWGSAPITCAEILADPAIRQLVPLSTSALGNLLSRCVHDGDDVGHYHIEKLPKREGNKSLWAVTARLPECIDRPGMSGENGPDILEDSCTKR